METDKKKRTVTRRQFSITAKNLEEILDEAERNSIPSCRVEAQVCHSLLSEYYRELTELDSKIQDAIVTLDQWEEQTMEKELEEAHKYKARWKFLDVRFNILKSEKETKEVTNIKKEKTEEKQERKFKLPLLEIRKFDGNIKNWLTFWGHFSKIDSDPEIEETDKLLYLIQSIEQNSEVRTFVEGFPLTKESYKLCINELKSRYAREDILIQIYVRELLSLILNKEKNFDLMHLYDSISSHLRALEVLKVTKEKYSAFLLPMVESALPTEILKVWERRRPVGGEDELNCLLEFLKKEVESNQRITLATEFKLENQTKQVEPAATCLAVNYSNSRKETQVKECIWCEKAHASTECFKIAKMTLEERREFLKKKRACALCLRMGHHAKICKSFIKCYVCGQRHSPVLCPGKPTPSNDVKPAPDKKNIAPVIQNYSAENPTSSTSTTLLQTVTLRISHGQKTAKVRAMFDSGSQRSYIKEEIMEKLNISPAGTEGLSHSLFGGATVSFKNYKTYDLTVQNMDRTFEFQMNALGQSIICKNVPKYNTDSKSLSELLNKHQIKLTDTDSEGSDIGLLIGADYSGLLLTNTFVQLESGLTAIKTSLGWTLQGKTNEAVTNCNVVTSLFCSQSISSFWNLEVLGIQDPVQVQSKQQLEEEVMQNFEESIQIDSEGRYEVQLPWKTGHDDLLSNRELAIRRLESATNKLVTCSKFQDYNNVLQEWEYAGIIERVPEPDLAEHKVHYLPHRAVCKESSLTTKLRPVFDASAKDKNGKSLNACLDKGINFLDKIPDLLIGFRTGCIGISADIAKAFLQVSVCPNDRNYLRFFWWKDKARRDFMEYRHCRVVFGLTSSPFLLSATIQHHLEQIKGEQKNTADILASSFYVDNLITSLDTEEATQHFIQEAKNIMHKAKFNLRQWVTSPLKINETEKTIISVLGLLWDTASDEILCNLSALPSSSEVGKINKRNLLSLTQKIYDPVGMLCPATLIPRLILQEIWNRKISWDEELPTDIKTRFYDWYDNIQLLENCRIPRRLSSEPLHNCTASLHMFCDASKDGYAACIFLRTEDSRGNVTIRLLSAKSRISPPEKITIPRLELLAALIGSRLITTARKRLQINSEYKEFCWSDSAVALCWIKRQLDWNTYVGNRVREIRQNTDVHNWHHIAGTENWADLPSRGCTPRQLIESRWWEGPPWLLQRPDLWPRSVLVVDEKEAHKELKKSACINTCCENGMVIDLSYFSKYTKIVRMTAWMLRFIHNTINKNNKRKGELSYEECEEAEMKIIKIIQNQNKELIEKETGKLTKFYDNDNILRLKTKLLLTDFPENVKTPVVLPAKNDIIRKMVEQRHQQLLHAGSGMMITDLRKRFWIIGVRRLVKSVIDKCIVCKRHRAKPTGVTTAPLPIERVQASAPFEVTGVDLAGPIYLRDGNKSWIVVYTCAVYRAVHLELTKSLSTEAFLMTLRRFISRRGRVSIMISDNGTNFTGAKNLLSSVDWNEVQRQSTIMRIKWKLNAPTAAWWGGFFERMIKIIKNLLRRVLGMSSVSYEEMQTLLCDCEAVVNDRPLTYVEGDNANALEPLKPSCFLQALPQSQVTDLDNIDATSLNRRLKYLQRLRYDFRQRFKSEYLTELVQRGKEKVSGIKIGDIVLVESEEKRVKWPLGLVVEIYTGRDGVDRTAKVKTSTGYKIRPFQRLYQLELSSSEVEGREGSQSEDIRGKHFILNPGSKSFNKEAATEPSMSDRQTTVRSTRHGRVIKLPSKYKI